VQGVETAMEWLLTKTDDETLDDPLDSDEEAEDKVAENFLSFKDHDFFKLQHLSAIFSYY
jgi:hypothetical protein